MLDTDTKRRIDTARDILVGKVPDPKSQVEQITIALIYKFMDDMDAEAESLGGKRKFFTGDFARFGWAQLMRPSLGGHDVLALYSEGISTMPQNKGIPPLFRDIFKNAYLPYRDPETLKAFLKIIDEFRYDHSERLGDAFEYLLSVLGSQGDAGQFRTPRHIIDFMVEVIAPQKNETVLDPACGTAGFLISAYKYILHTNTDAKGRSTLTPDDRGRLAKNFKGYDISPDMVRLSLVNLYQCFGACQVVNLFDHFIGIDRGQLRFRVALKAMTDATLAFIRDEGREDLPRVVDVVALIGSVCNDSADLGWEVTFTDRTWLPIRCFPDGLTRAVRNLIENAVRYGARARVRIVDEIGYVQILVDDDGPGIPPDDHERVFAPFVRLESSRNRTTGGVGLGLSIARTIMRSHGGDVTLANRSEGGLRACIILPHDEAHLGGMRPAAVRAISPPADAARGALT